MTPLSMALWATPPGRKHTHTQDLEPDSPRGPPRAAGTWRCFRCPTFVLPCASGRSSCLGLAGSDGRSSRERDASREFRRLNSKRLREFRTLSATSAIMWCVCVWHCVRRRDMKDTTKESALQASPSVAVLRRCLPRLFGGHLGCTLDRVVATSLPQKPIWPLRGRREVSFPPARRVTYGLHPPLVLPTSGLRDPSPRFPHRKSCCMTRPTPPRTHGGLVPPWNPCMDPQQTVPRALLSVRKVVSALPHVDTSVPRGASSASARCAAG